MFEQIREILDKYEQIVTADYDVWENNRDEYNKFLNEYVFDIAKALYTELPTDSVSKIAKIICIMDGNDLIKLKVE